MSSGQDALATLIAKDEIRELGMLYSRGVDRKDVPLLRTLYTKDATDFHGDTFSGGAEDYVDFLERSLPYMLYSGHHICNHLISVDGDTGEGEVYCIAYHVYSDGKDGAIQDLMTVRYVDRYRKEEGRWLFAARVVTYDMKSIQPIPMPEGLPRVPTEDPTYTTLSNRLFARGPRA